MGNPSTVMLIEDDTSMVAVLTTLLELEGYQVAVPPPAGVTLDGLLDSVRGCRPDIILLDMHLRQISGLDLLKRIRADADVRETRVVMSSGMDVKDACIQSGADSFLMKPFMPDELLGKLRG